MKQLLILLLLLCSASVFAQDVIVKKDGSTVVCRVVELTSSEIVYKRWSDQNGSNYVMNRTDASAINYENGKKVSLSEATNLYQPNNQNDGVQQYNDRALLEMDYAAYGPRNAKKKANIIRAIGCSVGAGMALAGALWISAQGKSGATGDTDTFVTTFSAGLMGGGVIIAIGSLVYANNIMKNANRIQASALYQKDFRINDHSCITAGADILSDHTMGSNTLGLGLRYNF